MRFNYRYILFIQVFAFLGNAQNKSIESEYYWDGLAAINNGLKNEAVSSFEKSISEYNDAQSYYELAKIYLDNGSFIERARALKLLKKAVFINPENLGIRMAYAELLEDFSKFSAIDQYENIISRDTTNLSARIKLAAIREKDFEEYYKSFRDMEGVLLAPLTPYALEDFKEAEFQYLKALEHDPKNVELLLAVSKLYQRSDSLKNAIKYLNQLSKVDPTSKEAHLYLGVCYNLTEEYEEAHKEFGKAITLMTFDEKTDFTLTSVIELLDPLFDGIDEIDNPKYVNNIVNAYWKMNDPLFKKGINERLLEHYTRVAYANLHYSVPEMGKTGWKTDRGKTVLRYGLPRMRKRLRGFMGGNGVVMKTEIWNYDDMIFAFTDQFSSGNYAYSAPMNEKSRYKSQFRGDSHTYAQNIKNVRHEDYKPPFYGKRLDITFDMPQLRNLNNSKITDLVLTYSYEAHDSTISQYDSLQNHLWSLQVYDNYFTNIFSVERNADPKNVVIRRIEDYNIYQNCEHVSLAPDSGYFSLKLYRPSDKGFVSQFQGTKIRDYSSTELLLSDIIFASHLVEHGLDYSLERGNISFNPVNSQLLEKEKGPYVYYEIYNLALDANRLTDFEIDINISRADGEGLVATVSSLVNNVLSLIGRDDALSFTFSSQYQTAEKNPQMYLQLDLSELENGAYEMQINVTDNVTGKNKSTEVEFGLL